MIFRNFYRIIILIFAAACIFACDDDINSIGQSIQPDQDSILLATDEIYLTAETVPLNEKVRDKIYVETETPLLGELRDATFKDLKADFLTELFTSGSSKFDINEDATSPIVIDSILLNLFFQQDGFTGDSISPFVVSAYQVNKKSLEANFYTNIDPAEYCDKSILLGQRYFNIHSLPILVFSTNSSTGASIYGRNLKVELDKSWGYQLLEDWKKDPSILEGSEDKDAFESFKEYFKGIYVTGDFKNKGIIEVLQADVNVHYSYTIKNVAKTEDSTVYRTLPFPMTNDGILMNRVINTPTEETVGIENNDQYTFIKAPGATATKITIDLAEIKKKAKAKTNSDTYNINLAKFKLVGMTEKEKELSFTKRPESLLFVNLDSLTSLNFNRLKVLDGATGIVMKRDSYNNTYNFAVGNTYSTDSYGIAASSNFSNNLAAIINYYIKQDSEKEKLEFLVLPVSTNESSSGYYGYSITNIANLYKPAAAILRTQKEYMKMTLVFSKHNPTLKE